VPKTKSNLSLSGKSTLIVVTMMVVYENENNKSLYL